MNTIITSDHEVALLMAEIRSPLTTNLMTGVTGLGTAVAALVFLYIFYRAGWEKEFLMGLGSHSLNALIVVVLMKTIKRPFPPQPVCKTGFDAVTSSFPSGHAASAAVFAFIAWKSENLATFPVAVLALLVSFSRVYLGTHYLSDTVLGGVMGLLMAYLVSQRLKWVEYLFERLADSTDFVSSFD